MINISKEIKNSMTNVDFLGQKFDPFFVDENNKLLIELYGNIHKTEVEDEVILGTLFLMYKKFESQDIKIDLSLRVVLKDRKIKSVYYEIHDMAAITEEGDFLEAYSYRHVSTYKERIIFLSYISHCINELIRRGFND